MGFWILIGIVVLIFGFCALCEVLSEDGPNCAYKARRWRGER